MSRSAGIVIASSIGGTLFVAGFMQALGKLLGVDFGADSGFAVATLFGGFGLGLMLGALAVARRKD